MAQHFLLSAKARTLTLQDIFTLSDSQAHDLFQQIRWPDTDGQPICPHCGVVDDHYWLSGFNRWKCSACKTNFSVTSKTIFAHHKLPLKTYLAAIAIFVNGAKGHAALQLSRDLGIQYKTAFVLSHKIRTALYTQQDLSPLHGQIEVDGSYYGGVMKPENRKEERLDRRLKENQNNKRRCVLVLRQKGKPTEGATKTKIFLVDNENANDINEIVKNHAQSDANLFTDEHPAYDSIARIFPTKRVNHKLQYSDLSSGANINQSESYFSRLRRAELGNHHHFSGPYLIQYANEMAYREDTRRKDNKWIFKDVLTKATNTLPTQAWKGYWQRHTKAKVVQAVAT